MEQNGDAGLSLKDTLDTTGKETEKNLLVELTHMLIETKIPSRFHETAKFETD